MFAKPCVSFKTFETYIIINVFNLLCKTDLPDTKTYVIFQASVTERECSLLINDYVAKQASAFPNTQHSGPFKRNGMSTQYTLVPRSCSNSAALE